ncbi:MAG: hypothetical protein CHACPFDD_01266 [Phycisphaerae bacterium]|nr:hypothetical protein [Phycisphaerae bacterium]
MSSAAELAQRLLQPLHDLSWSDWRDFWLAAVLDDRFLVCFFAVPLLALLAAPRRWFRHAIIITGAAWLAFCFGALYVLIWFAACLAFHRLAERYALESRRADVLPWAPHAAAAVCIAGLLLVVQAAKNVSLPESVCLWLYENARWLFPYGARGTAWEPWLAPGPRPDGATPAGVQLFEVMLANPHNIGVAYFAVRMLHYFFEVRRGTIAPQRRSLLNFLAWTCYAPTLMQGPIERFDAFHDEMETCFTRRSWWNVPPALARVALGIAKSLLTTAYFAPWLTDDFRRAYFHEPHSLSYATLYFGVYAMIFAIYLEFSGYCDVAAGIARLLGYRQVENFNWPWLATSLRDFWRRWHISLSLVLRDYLYIPFGGSRRHHVRNLILTFGICGLWHVPTFGMFLWGAIIGLMVAINHAWARLAERLDTLAAPRDGRTAPTPARAIALAARIRAAWLGLRPLPQIAAWAVTIHFFVMSLLFFFGGLRGALVLRELLVRPLRYLAP